MNLKMKTKIELCFPLRVSPDVKSLPEIVQYERRVTSHACAFTDLYCITTPSRNDMLKSLHSISSGAHVESCLHTIIRSGADALVCFSLQFVVHRNDRRVRARCIALLSGLCLCAWRWSSGVLWYVVPPAAVWGGEASLSYYNRKTWRAVWESPFRHGAFPHPHIPLRAAVLACCVSVDR